MHAALTRQASADVRRVLTRYAQAYQKLDARAAAAVWPGADVRALERAFSGLSSQSLVFDRCDYVIGKTTASASCLGVLTVVRRVGSSAPFVQQLQWTFRLARDGDDWRIAALRTDH